MDEQEVRKDVDPICEGVCGLSFREVIHDFYNRKMLSWIVVIWIYSLVFVGVAVYSGIKFFDATEPKVEIAYAVLFICCVQFICLMKIISWQLIHRNGIMRALKQLEKKILSSKS